MSSTPPMSNVPPPPSAPKAANLLLVSGVIETFVFGLIALACVSLAVTPLEEVQQQMKLTSEQQQVMTTFKPLAGPTAVTLAALGVAPGLAFLALSFGVRAGRYVATQTSLLLVATQLIVFGMLFFAEGAAAVVQGNPGRFTVNVMTFGSLLLLLGFTMKHLLEARLGAKLALRSNAEPWDSPDE